MATIIAVVALMAVVSWAIWYIVTEKKRGNACIGCSVEGTCGLETPKRDAADNLDGRKTLPLTPVATGSKGAKQSGSGGVCCF